MRDYTKIPLNVIPSVHDDRDYRPGMFVPVSVNSTEDIMLDYLPAIYDQSVFPMCCGFAGAANRESQQYRETMRQVRMSPGFIYGNRYPSLGDYCGEGMQPRDVCAHLVKEGVCSYDDMPMLGNYAQCHAYLTANITRLAPLAMPNRSLSYVGGFTEDEIATMLRTNMGPVMLTYAVYENFDRTLSDGIVLDKRSTDSLRGYHEMVIVGRITINGRRYWVVHNSWGIMWGKRGVCFIPVDSPDIIEAWGITDYVPNERAILMDCEPVIIPPGRMAAPARYLAGALGGSAIWNQDTQTATFIIPPTAKTLTIEMSIGSQILRVK